jgi:hypothetical protein
MMTFINSMFRPVSIVVGVLPTFTTFKALDAGHLDGVTESLTYWLIFGLLTLVEVFLGFLLRR